ncbi:MAG TPA: POTRA domain-containing protein, partial [Povalibacter sp.]|nr:POTRA domain-containing protein [Povalibacter sp.]
MARRTAGGDSRARMPLSRIVLACLLFLAPFCVRAAGDASKLELAINGLKPALESAVRGGLTLQQYLDRSVSEAQLRRLVSVGEDEIRGTLESWGYYAGEVKSRLEPTDTGSFKVVYDVNPGEPVLVTESSV